MGRGEPWSDIWLSSGGASEKVSLIRSGACVDKEAGSGLGREGTNAVCGLARAKVIETSTKRWPGALHT